MKKYEDVGAAMRKLTSVDVQSWFASTSGEHAPIDNLKEKGRETHGNRAFGLSDVSVSKWQSSSLSGFFRCYGKFKWCIIFKVLGRT